jgi:hypothetical protein
LEGGRIESRRIPLVFHLTLGEAADIALARIGANS